MQSGASLAGQAGSTITEVVTSIDKVTALMGELCLSTQEQCLGISQVESAANQMNGVTQHNAALVEESAAAAHSLSEQAVHSISLASIFKVNARLSGQTTVGSSRSAVLLLSM